MKTFYIHVSYKGSRLEHSIFFQVNRIIKANNSVTNPRSDRFKRSTDDRANQHRTSECIHLEPPHDKTNKMACASSEDTDKPGHPPSLIRAFAVRMKNAWVLTNPLSALRRL